MGFRTAEPTLKDVLDGIAKGETQLPDFQRGWVWDDPHITSLIASLSLSYPIGSVMFLEAGGVPFKPRLFTGVALQPSPTPKTLVLDGQQRLTSMFLALRSGLPVPTRTVKGEDIERIYFLDMAKCLDEACDREDAVLSVPGGGKDPGKIMSDFGRKVDLDLSTPEGQFANDMFPVPLMFDTTNFMKWKTGYVKFHAQNPAAFQFLMQFEQEIWLRFQQYNVPAIELTADTPPAAVCQVFEKVNTGGVTLTVFELVTAMFAAHGHNLRDDWDARRKRIVHRRPILEDIDGTDLLTSVTLLANYEKHVTGGSAVSCKRADVLRLSLCDYQTLVERIEKGFQKAAELLMEEKIFDRRSLPYGTQLIPMAAICAVLHDVIDQHAVRQKVRRWYWCGVFGELYGAANETRYALDLPGVIQWAKGGEEPRTVKDATFAPTRLLSLQTRNAAAYKGLAALLMKKGGSDFISGTPIDVNTYFDKAIDIHHIFPVDWIEDKQPRDRWNSVVNKAPLAASTNRYIGGVAPSAYLAKIEKYKEVPASALDEHLTTHLISIPHLRADDFQGFLCARATALLDLIEDATGKVITGRDSEECIQAFGQSLLVEGS